MAQVLIELNEGGGTRRKFVDVDSVALWAEAGWAVPPGTSTGSQATGYDAAVADAIRRIGSLSKAAIDERVTAVGDATYAPLGLSRMAVATYALMHAVTPDPNAVTRVKVANDENKGIAHTIYEVWPDGARIWLATTTEG